MLYGDKKPVALNYEDSGSQTFSAIISRLDYF